MNIQERRKHPRHASRTPLHISTRNADGSESTLQCPCRDISGGGLSFLCPRPVTLEIGQRISIAIFSAGPATPLDFGKGTIVWVQDEADEDAWVGVMLDELLDEQHLKELIGIL
ncbi:MAG: PilZ domain-containing protein [Mariprofundaceae bacterium]